MIRIGKIDPQMFETANAIVRLFHARARAGFQSSSLYYDQGFHSVFASAPSPTAVEIKRIDGAAWDLENTATLFNDVCDALGNFHQTRAQVAAQEHNARVAA